MIVFGRKHAMQSRQVPLTEVAVEPDCEDITAVWVAMFNPFTPKFKK